MFERLAGDLLGGKVRELTIEHVAGRAADGGPAHRSRDSKVAELHLAELRQVDVRRRHVAMNDPHRLTADVTSRMDAFKRAQEFAGNVGRESGREGTPIARKPSQQAEEVAPVDELHGEPWLVTDFAVCVDLHYISVAHSRMQGRLPLEHGAPLRVSHELRQKPFDDQRGRVSRAIDRPRHVHLGCSAHGQARVEPEWPELDWTARQRSGNGSPRRLFARRHADDECIYAEAARITK